jgi:DNA sulfur modification protein DndB
MPSRKVARVEPKPLSAAIEIPAIRGIQAGCEYYTVMIPLRQLAKLFEREDQDIPPELRAQRLLNTGRAKKIRNYVVENPQDYVLNSITVMIDPPNSSNMEFVPIQPSQDWGMLRLPLDTKFFACDGQHRIEGLKAAVSSNPELGDETISVVFYLFSSLRKAQQMFRDLNSYGVKPSTSLSMSYEHRDPEKTQLRDIKAGVSVFARFTDMEKTALPPKSSKLFTLNAIDAATRSLLKNCPLDPDGKTKLAIAYWNLVAKSMKDWQAVCDRTLAASDARQNYVYSHAVTLEAIETLGWALLNKSEWVLTDDITASISSLESINWERSNPDWENVFIFDGKIRKDRVVVLNLAKLLNQKIKATQNI